MPMDPDSPFARLGGGSAVEGARIGWLYSGEVICKGTEKDPGCQHVWTVPVNQGGAIASACPKCHRTTGLILRDGSVQEAPPPRK